MIPKVTLKQIEVISVLRKKACLILIDTQGLHHILLSKISSEELDLRLSRTYGSTYDTDKADLGKSVKISWLDKYELFLHWMNDFWLGIAKNCVILSER